MKAAICTMCGKENDAYTGVSENANEEPTEGAVSLCIGCGAASIFTGNGLEVRRPTDDELIELAADPGVRRAQVAIRLARGWTGGGHHD